MESLSELQNPLLPRNPAHLHGPYPYPEASPTWPSREKIYSYLLGGAGPAHAHQLLDPGSLQLAVEAWYRPNCLLGRDKVKEPRAGSCETSFTESREPPAGPTERSTEPGQAEEDVTIQTVSYGVQEELQGQEDDQEEEEEVSMCVQNADSWVHLQVLRFCRPGLGSRNLYVTKEKALLTQVLSTL